MLGARKSCRQPLDASGSALAQRFKNAPLADILIINKKTKSSEITKSANVTSQIDFLEADGRRAGLGGGQRGEGKRRGSSWGRVRYDSAPGACPSTEWWRRCLCLSEVWRRSKKASKRSIRIAFSHGRSVCLSIDSYRPQQHRPLKGPLLTHSNPTLGARWCAAPAACPSHSGCRGKLEEIKKGASPFCLPAHQRARARGALRQLQMIRHSPLVIHPRRAARVCAPSVLVECAPIGHRLAAGS